MAIAVSGVQVELREVVLRDKPLEMLEASPKGTVPVLDLPDDEVLEESLDIMHWALAQHDPDNWLAHVDDGLVEANDGPFKHALDRYKYPHRYELADGFEHRESGLVQLTDIDAKLRPSPFLGGERPRFTDIALVPFVRQFAATDQAWFDAQSLPALHRWLSSLLQSVLFGSIMARYPRWKAGDPITLFP
jgi:glutathione S-transferase